ncbi:MAG TPA: phosphate/phosphite/phosphonate ABC transporter substrate-binding protein [Geobacteraceae bacterium]
MVCNVVSTAAVTMTVLFFFVMTGCSKPGEKEVRLDRTAPLKPYSSANRQRTLRIGMGAMITPKEGYIYYHQLRHYLESKLGIPVQLVDRDTYEQLNKSLKAGDVEAAFICAGPYVEGRHRFGLELLAVPQVNGEAVYRSYIIVPKESPVHDFDGLRGKVFAFTDPKSNSGMLVPTYMLALKKESPETFFKKTMYTYGHDRSIKMVAEKLVDGAAVDSLIWEFTAKKNPALTAQTRIVARSTPFGIPPFVVIPSLDQTLKKRLWGVLLTMHDDPEGRKILDGMMIDKFVDGDDRAYDSIREMNAWVAGQNRGRRP